MSIPVKDSMHDMIAWGIDFLDMDSSTRALKHDTNISEPLVVLSYGSLFEKQRWTTMREWMIMLLRNAPTSPTRTLGYVFPIALPLVLMGTFGGKFSPLEEAFNCGSKSLGSRRVTLVSLKRVAGDLPSTVECRQF